MSSGDGDNKNGSIRFVKISGKGSDFMEWTVNTMPLTRKKGFVKYLTEVEDEADKKYEDGNADVYGINCYSDLQELFSI